MEPHLMRLAKALIVAETMLRECSTQSIKLGELREVGVDGRMLSVFHLVLQAGALTPSSQQVPLSVIRAVRPRPG
jgi:hypothetical protein